MGKNSKNKAKTQNHSDSTAFTKSSWYGKSRRSRSKKNKTGKKLYTNTSKKLIKPNNFENTAENQEN